MARFLSSLGLLGIVMVADAQQASGDHQQSLALAEQKASPNVFTIQLDIAGACATQACLATWREQQVARVDKYVPSEYRPYALASIQNEYKQGLARIQQAAAEKVGQKAAAEKATAEKKATAEDPAAEKSATEKVAAEKAAGETKAASEKDPWSLDPFSFRLFKKVDSSDHQNSLALAAAEKVAAAKAAAEKAADERVLMKQREKAASSVMILMLPLLVISAYLYAIRLKAMDKSSLQTSLLNPGGGQSLAKPRWWSSLINPSLNNKSSTKFSHAFAKVPPVRLPDSGKTKSWAKSSAKSKAQSDRSSRPVPEPATFSSVPRFDIATPRVSETALTPQPVQFFQMGTPRPDEAV